MCLSRSDGTGVVVRRRVSPDARLPVAILLPVPPTSSPPPPPTAAAAAKVFVLCVTLFLSAVGCSADDTERTGSGSGKADRVSEVVETANTVGDRRTTAAKLADVVALSRSQTTPENIEKFSKADPRSYGSNAIPETPASMSAQPRETTAGDRHFRSSTAVPEVAEEVSSTSSLFLTLTSASGSESPTASLSFSIGAGQSTTDNVPTTDKMLDLSSKTAPTEDKTSTATTAGETSDVTEAQEVTSSRVAADVELSVRGLAADDGGDRGGKSGGVEGGLSGVGGGVDAFYRATSAISTDSNTWLRDDDDDDERRRATTATNRSSSSARRRGGGTKRCLRMRTGGGDDVRDCYPHTGGSAAASDGRRRLEFCDAYSAYVADFDCAPSSSCLDYLCEDVVRLDRLARSMNDQFVDGIFNYYDCKSAYSGVWNCSACKVTISRRSMQQ